MAITWGAWEYASGNGIRLGIEVTRTEVVNTSADVTFYIKVYTQNQYPFSSDNQNLDFDDDLEPLPDIPYVNNEGTAPVYRATVTYVHTYTTYGTSPGTRIFCSELDGGAGGVTPNAKLKVTIPARPYSLPAAPTSLVATRVSDSQVNISWTRNSTASGFYSNQVLQWRQWIGTTAWTDADWSPKIPLPGTSSGVAAVGFVPNRVYQVRLRAENNVGPSAWTTSSVIFMTPAAPTVLASRTSTDGASITTTWTDNHYTYGFAGTWTVQRSVAGGAFSNVATGIPRGTTFYTDPSPGAGTNQYRVAAVVSTLTSEWGTGLLVSEPTAPPAPTLLAPDGEYADFVNDDVTLTWQFNPSTDYAEQSWVWIYYSDDGGSSWLNLPSASPIALTVGMYTIPAGTLTNGIAYLWRLHTVGSVAASPVWSPSSAVATITGSTTPTATITYPGDPCLTIPLRAEWTYAQAEMVPQYGFKAVLYDSDGNTLEEIIRYTADTFVDFAYTAVSGQTYSIAVSVWSTYGLLSFPDEVETTFILYPPAAVTMSGTYNLCAGTVTLTLAAEAAVPGSTIDVVSATVERRVLGGDWVILATGLLLPTAYVDGLPLTNGLNEYRATGLSAAPSTSTNTAVPVPGVDGDAAGDPLWVWISYGDTFEFDLRVHGDLQVEETSGRERTVRHFLGRAAPVAFLGQNTTRTVTVSGSLSFERQCTPTSTNECRYDSTPAEWRALGSDAELVCYRDYTGRRFFGTVSDVRVTDDTWPGRASVSFTVTETYFVERYVQMVEA